MRSRRRNSRPGPPFQHAQGMPRTALALLALLLLTSCKPGCEDTQHKAQPSPPRTSSEVKRNCDTGDWLTYGRDARRSSATPGCCVGPLREAWRFNPDPVGGRKARLNHAIATADAVYASSVIGDSPGIHRVSLSGEPVWVFDSRVDITHGFWPTFGLNQVTLNDDGLYIVDPNTGRKRYDRGLDSWGQTLTDTARLYLVNTWHVAGPRVLVGGYDPEGNAIWQQNVSGATREDVKDIIGGLALDEGILFQAADYQFVGFAGLFAFDGGTGDQRWAVDTRPASTVSAGGGKVYLMERETRGGPLSLVARSQKDGKRVWSSPAQGTDGAAPVVTPSLVLTFSHEDGVAAWNADDGHLVWTAWVAASPTLSTGHATHVAVASGSRTVVVAVGPSVALLSLDDGKELSRSDDASEAGSVRLHSPAIARGKVYVVTEGELRAFECGPNEP